MQNFPAKTILIKVKNFLIICREFKCRIITNILIIRLFIPKIGIMWIRPSYKKNI